MTEKGRQVHPRRWAVERLRDKVFDWLVLSFLGFLAVAFFRPLQDRVVAIWESPKTQGAFQQEVKAELISLGERVDTLGEKVQRLQLPDQVFEMSLWNTGPVDGYCVEGEECTFRVRLRRLEEALPCEIVPGSVRWGFINPDSDSFVVARRVDEARSRNIGPTWEDIEVTLMTPYGLEPEADFTFEASYRNCPGSNLGDDPVSFDSPRDPTKIRPAQKD